MPNNFKLVGDYYVSKAGNDSNTGTSPDSPLLTIQAALNKSNNSTIIVASGVYTETLSKTAGNGGAIRLLGDGTVVLDGQYSRTILFRAGGVNSIGTILMRNLEFRNYLLATFQGDTSNNAFTSQFIDCVFNNMTMNCVLNSNNSGEINSFLRCRFINTRSTSTIGWAFITNQATQIVFDSCIIYNSFLTGNDFVTSTEILNTGISLFTNNYVDENSTLKTYARSLVSSRAAVTSISPSNFNYNNIQGKIMMPFSGSVSGTGSYMVAQNFAQHRLDYPTYNVNSFSSDPLFNNSRIFNFSLQSGSPHINAASDYQSNIGGTEYAVAVSASSAEFTTNASSFGLQLIDSSSYTISGSEVTGSITSGPIFLQWPRTKPLTSLIWQGDLNFNKSVSGGLSGNTNVPDWQTYMSESQGGNPDRLKINMRYSTQQNQPSSDSEWDNGGYWSAGSYEMFEINQKPKVDPYGRGNGNPEYVEYFGLGDLVPSWVQVQVKLINNYN